MYIRGMRQENIFSMLILLSISTAGCDRTYGVQACRMEHEIVLAGSANTPEDVSVVALETGRYAAVYSVDGATYGVFFDNEGHSVSPPLIVPRRLGEKPLDDTLRKSAASKTFWPNRETVSIHAVDIDTIVLNGSTVAAALLARPTPVSAGGAFLVLLNEEGVQRNVALGPAGEYASRISLVADEEDIIVAWHDGMLSGSRVRLARLDRKSRVVAKREILKNDSASPALAMSDGQPAMAWSETVAGDRGGKSTIKVALFSKDLDLDSGRTVATSRFVYPSPSLSASRNGFALLFRDDEDGDETPEYHFLALSSAGKITGDRERISTSDGLRGPTLVESGDGFIGATIRSFQRNLLIGLNRLDGRGRKMGGEFQVYADKSDFVRVDIAERGGKVVIVYAEERHDRGRVLAGTVTCSPRQ